jgi:hypothetical protein
MKVFISSPYSIGDQAVNVNRQIICANELMDLGFTPFLPLLSHFQHLVHPRPYEDWINNDLDWLKSCDVLLRLPGESKGADMEVEKAKEYGIPVCNSIKELLK